MPNNAYHRRSDSPFVHAYNSLSLLVNSGLDNYVASRSNRSTQTFNVNDPVVIKTCKLAETVVNRLLGTMSPRSYSKLDRSDQAMCELVYKMLYRYEITFRNMLKRSLNINRYNGYSAFSALVDDVLCDGPTWGRIAVLYAYGGCLVVDCRKKGLNEFANKMTNYIGLYVGDKAGHWIKKQGGWDKLIMLNNGYHRRSDSPFVQGYNPLNLVVNSGCDNYVASRSNRSTQTFNVNDPVVIKACKLAETVVNRLLGTMSRRRYCILDGSDQAMCELVDKMLYRNEITIRNKLKRSLNINRNNGSSAFSALADDVLCDGPTWRRIAVLYAYGGYLVVDCRKQGLNKFAKKMTNYIGLYVGDKAGHWIKKQGGWDKLIMLNNGYHRRSDSPFVQGYNPLNLVVNSGCDNYVASRSNRSTQTFNVNDPVVIKTCKLAETVVNRLLGTMSRRRYCKLDGSDQAMGELVDKMLYRNEIKFRNKLIRSLNINRNNGYSAFSALADDVLCDGPTWRRIAVLYAYGGYLVVDCRTQGLNEFANKMTDYIGLYVGDKAGHWIKKQEGWDGLIMLNNAYRRSDSPFMHAYNSLNVLVNSGLNYYVSSRSTQTFDVNDPVVIKACKLAETVVNHLLGTMSLRSYWKLDGSDQAMCEYVGTILWRYEILLRKMVKRRLKINRNNGYSAFSDVADDVLRDGPTWHRIAALYAYGGYLVVDCRKQGLYEFANEMTDYIGLYVGHQAGHWIKKQGGWESFVDWKVKQENFSYKFFKGLVVIGLVFAR